VCGRASCRGERAWWQHRGGARTWLGPHQAKCCHNKKNKYNSSCSHDHRAIFQKSPKFAMLVYWNVTTQTLDMWSGRTVS